jgi:hypothetical protein
LGSTTAFPGFAFPEFLEPADVAERIGVSPKTLALWRQQGIGPGWIKCGPRLVRYPGHSLASWIEANKRTSTAQSE